MEPKAYLSLQASDDYPYYINKMIRLLQEKGLNKLTGIQTKILGPVENHITGENVGCEHILYSNIADIEIEKDCLFLLIHEHNKPESICMRICLKFDSIIGFIERLK